MAEARLISFVARSDRRKEILEILSKGRIAQSAIMKKTNMYKGHVSRILKELLNYGLIICENPEDRSFKFYKISKKGKDILIELNKIYL